MLKTIKGVNILKKFCKKCGTPLNKAEKCPNCDAVLPAKFKKTVKKILVGLIIILTVYTVALFSVGALVYFDKINIPFFNNMFISMGIKEPVVRIPEPQQEQESNLAEKENSQQKVLADEYRATPPNAKDYYNNNSNVLSEFSATDSKSVLTESEVCELLTQRGFDCSLLTTDYLMGGKYESNMEVSAYSSEKHPMYQMNYITPSGDVWSILIINDSIFASPLSYNMQDVSKVPLVVSETDKITSYDGTTDKFFVTTPNENVLIIKKVQKIDADRLNSLTKEEIDKL